MLAVSLGATAQVSLTGPAAVTQNFNTMTTTTLPAGWKMGAQGGTSYATAAATVTQSANTGMPTTGGTYRWGLNGSYANASVGAMTSGSFSSPNNLMVAYKNNYTGYRLVGYNITVSAKRFRKNTTAATVKLQYSTNGTSWTDITGGSGSPVTSYTWTGGTSTYNFATPESQAMTSGSITLAAPVAVGGNIYFGVNLNTGGTNSQGLAIDDFTFTPVFSATTTVTTPTIQTTNIRFSNVTGTGFTVAWTKGNGSARVIKINPSVNTFGLPVDGTDPTASSAYTTPGQVIYKGSDTVVTVTGLSPGVLYYLRAFEFNGTGVDTKFLGGSGTGNPGSQLTPAACPTVRINIAQSICLGDTFVFRGRRLFTAGTYRDTVKYGNNCDSVRVLTLQTPSRPVTPVISGGDIRSLCIGDTLRLTATAPAGTFIWSNGATSASIVVRDSGYYSVRALLGTCTSDTSPVIQVVLRPAPTALHIDTAAGTAFCAGDSIMLSASPDAEGYIWNTSATTRSIYVSATGSYTVRAVSGSCTSAASPAVVTRLRERPGRPAVAASGALTFCRGENINLSASLADRYLWSNGATTQTIRVDTAGTYSVQVISGSCTSLPSGAMVVSVLPAPARPDITASGSLTIADGDSVMLSGPAGFTYLWSTGQTSQSIWAHSAGTYVLSVSENGCSSSDTVVVTMLQSVAEDLNKPSMHFYPNPAGDHLTLFMPGQCLVQLYNAGGKLIIHQEITDRGEFNLHGIPAGFYMLRCISNGRVTVNKVQIQ
ncbi:MAG: T9SS type A sorting domain-containing protein [Bacteroidota bacterium]